MSDTMIERLTACRAALAPFAGACEQISEAESNEEWAKFRLLIGDYRRARDAAAMIDAALAEG